MSEIGYNGRLFTISLDSTVIAAVQSKTVTHAREAVDVTNDDSDGWRTLLPDPGVRSMDVSVEGVATEDNYQLILDEWAGVVNSAITITHADGSTATASRGFFLGNIEFSGESDGHVAFTASLQSSGVVTITPAP